MQTTTLLESIKKLKAIADVGLLYGENEYDRERYAELQQIVFEMLEGITGYNLPSIECSFPQATDYPTAKVDIRTITLSEDHKILLVQEADGTWTLPGGWADIGYSPMETAIKETKEEAGIEVAVEALLAVFDKRLHPHPPHADYVYKLVFFCKQISHELNHGFDMAGAAFFDIENLPALSTERMLKSQIELLYLKIMEGDFKTHFE